MMLNRFFHSFIKLKGSSRFFCCICAARKSSFDK